METTRNIFPKNIEAGTRFVVNGVTYAAESAAQPIGNGRKFHVIVATDSGTRQAIILPASDTVRGF